MNELQHNELTAATERIKLRLRRTAEDIIAIGQDLISIKKSLPHGEFLPWIEREFEMKERTARNFISVAERFPKSAIIADFKPSVLYELAAPSTPPEVVQQVTAKVEQGETVTVAQVKELRRQAKEAELAANEAFDALETKTTELERMQKHNDSIVDAMQRLQHQVEALSNREPETITEYIDAVPDGYTSIEEAIADKKRKLKELESEHNKLCKDHNRMRKSLESLNEKAKQDKSADSACYRVAARIEDLTSGIQSSLADCRSGRIGASNLTKLRSAIQQLCASVEPVLRLEHSDYKDSMPDNVVQMRVEAV